VSHARLLVIGDDLDAQMAPYDENKEVEPYKDYEAGEPWFARSAKEDGIDPTDLEALAAWHNAKYAGDGERPYSVDENGLFTMSTYNPQSKWDWWSIGGRFAGQLMVKPGVMAALPNVRVNPFSEELAKQELEHFAPVMNGRFTDQAIKADVDIRGMRAKAAAEAADGWDEFQSLTMGTPPAVVWSDFVARVEAKEITIEMAREAYHAQPRIRLVRANEKYRWNDADFIVDMQGSRDAFVLRRTLAAVPGFATLIHGEWHEPGKMGWWGMSSDTLNDRIGYWETINGLIDAAGDDELLTNVDYHI
jgi:hypothetical protein